MAFIITLLLVKIIPVAHATQEHDLYTKYFPTHVEFFTFDGIKLKKSSALKKRAAYLGHSGIFIQGLCKDPRFPYPKVIPCIELPSEMRGDGGVGISLAFLIKNRAWLATPGYDFFLNAGKDKIAMIDQTAIQGAIQEAIRLEIYSGAKLGPENNLAITSRDYETRVASRMLGTDFAMQFARRGQGIRIPIQNTSLIEIANYLNEINAPYVQGKKVFNRFAPQFNCATQSKNILKKLKVLEGSPFEVDHLLFPLFLTGPRNAYFSLVDQHFYQKKNLKKLPIDGAPGSLGTLLVEHPFFELNQYFSPQTTSIFLPPKPITRICSLILQGEKARTIPEFTQLNTHAKVWLEKFKTEKNPSLFLQEQIQIAEKIIKESEVSQ